MFYSNLSKTVVLSVGVIVTAFLLSVIVLAWTEPGATPPGGNVPAPVNVGGAGQVKRYVDNSNKGWLGIATDNYDLSFGLTVGYIDNKIGLKVRGDSYFQGKTSDDTSAALNVANDAGTSLLYVRNDGHVGIGTPGPEEKLDISGNLKINEFRIKRISATEMGMYDSGDNLVLIFDEGN